MVTITSHVTIKSSATVANFGGYDIGGFSLDKPANRYVFQQVDKGFTPFDRSNYSVAYGGTYDWQLDEIHKHHPNPNDKESELINRTMSWAIEKYKMKGFFEAVALQYYPLRKGGGMSAAARGAVLFGLNEVGHLGLTHHDITREAASLEGHWDNIAPNIFGGYVFIIPTADGEAKLIRYEPVGGHGVLLAVPATLEKQSTNVLRPPVDDFETDHRGLTEALYNTGMVVASSGNSSFLSLPEGRQLDVVDEFARGVPDIVKMSEITSRSRQITNYIHENYERYVEGSGIDNSRRITILGRHSTHERTATKVRADIKGYGPYTHTDFEAVTGLLLPLEGYLAINGAGPSWVIHFDESRVSDEAIADMGDIIRDFWWQLGYAVTIIRTRPSSRGVQILSDYNNGHLKGNTITVPLAAIERLTSPISV